MSPSASEAAVLAGSGDAVIGWKLDRDQRHELLKQFPPTFPNTVADHVTLAAGAAPDAPLPQESGGEIIGIAQDDSGVEAMVVAIGGTTDRPDGGTYPSHGRSPPAATPKRATTSSPPTDGWTSTFRPR